jgi:hypothetical protein
LNEPATTPSNFQVPQKISNSLRIIKQGELDMNIIRETDQIC